jgi:hypothetical protein
VSSTIKVPPPHFILSVNLSFPSASKSPPPPSISAARITVDGPSHRLPLPLRRSGSPTGPRSCSPHHQANAFLAGELSCRHCAGELPPQRHPSSSIYFQGHHLAAPLRRGPWMRPTRTLPTTIQPPAISAQAVPRALLAVWAVMWAIHVLHYRPR